MVKPELSAYLKQQLTLAHSAAQVLRESADRSEKLLTGGTTLGFAEMETLEAVTARFSRLSDLLFQRVFRTLDQIELVDDGTHLDRLNRCEKRAIIDSATVWREIREVRNAIAHDYLVEAQDTLLTDVLRHVPELLATVMRIDAYARARGY